MNREQELNKMFPLEDGTTYIQSIDNTMCEYSGLPSTQSYDKSNEPKGAGVGGESIKENFIDSASPKLEESASVDSSDKRDIDFMYKWIRKHSNK